MTFPFPTRRAIAIAAIAFLIRIAAVAATGHDRTAFGDAADYVATATHLCRTGTYPERGNLPFFRAPGLPFFVAAVTACEPERLVVIKVSLAAVDTMSVALVMLLAFRLFGSPFVTMLSGAAAALHPLFVLSVTDVRSEPLFMMLLLAALLGLLRAAQEISTRWAAAAGAAIGLAALTRPVALLFIAFFAVTLLIRSRALRLPAVLVIASAIVVGPWTVRNYLRYGEWIAVNDAGGYNLWRGSHPAMARIYRTEDRKAFRAASVEFEQAFTEPMSVRIAAAAATPGARSAAWRRSAIQNISADPSGAASFALQKAFLYWRPWLNPREYSRTAVTGSAAVLIVLLAGGIGGIVRLWRIERRLALWTTAFLLSSWLVHIPHQVVMRFRYPLTDPIFIILAAWLTPALLPSPSPALPTSHREDRSSP